MTMSAAIIAPRTAFIGLDAVVTFVANIMSIVVTWKTPEIAEMTKIFATSLALADISVGFLVFFSIASSAADQWLYGDVLCQIIGVMGPSFVMISVWSLLCVSADRYMAVTKPLRYYDLVTRRRAVAVLAVCWCSSIGANIYIAFNKNLIIYDSVLSICLPEWGNQDILWYLMTVCTIWIAIPSALTIAIYVTLFRISRRHARQIAALGAPSRDRDNPGRRPADARAIRTMFTVTGAFNLAYMPFLFCNMYANLSPSTPLPNALKFVSMWLMLSNSWWNFFIYMLVSRNFRRTAARLFCKNCCKQTQSPETSMAVISGRASGAP